MSTLIERRNVSIRKSHRCRICHDGIDPPAQCISLRCLGDDGYYTLYLHDDCDDYSASWDDDDWGNSNPGSVGREEVQRALQGGGG